MNVHGKKSSSDNFSTECPMISIINIRKQFRFCERECVCVCMSSSFSFQCYGQMEKLIKIDWQKKRRPSLLRIAKKLISRCELIRYYFRSRSHSRSRSGSFCWFCCIGKSSETEIIDIPRLIQFFGLTPKLEIENEKKTTTKSRVFIWQNYEVC